MLDQIHLSGNAGYIAVSKISDTIVNVITSFLLVHEEALHIAYLLCRFALVSLLHSVFF